MTLEKLKAQLALVQGYLNTADSSLVKSALETQARYLEYRIAKMEHPVIYKVWLCQSGLSDNNARMLIYSYELDLALTVARDTCHEATGFTLYRILRDLTDYGRCNIGRTLYENSMGGLEVNDVVYITQEVQ